MIRVCHLGKYYPPAHGGIETHTRTLARAQSDLGLRVRVLCVNHRSRRTEIDHDGPIPITRIGRLVEIDKLDICPGLTRAIKRVEREVDIFHLQAPNPTMLLALLAARPKIPTVVTYQSDVIRQRIREFLFRPFEKAAYRYVDRIMPTSPTYPAGSRFLRGYSDRVHVVPLGINLEEFIDPDAKLVEEARKIRAEHPGPIWMSCGRLVYYKGLLNAIRALSRVEGKLFLVGQGPERRSLEREAARLGVSDRVIFLGGLPDVRDLIPWYLAATAFWFPSNARSEAFGLAQVEAMACGCPVINTFIPHSGVSWVSPHEQTGLTIAVDDPAALADASNRLLREPGLRQRLSAAARKRSIEEFNHKIMAERNIQVYEDLLLTNRIDESGVDRLPASAAVEP
jgi:glycosyltransferase involved in cell wall biosynthesis